MADTPFLKSKETAGACFDVAGRLVRHPAFTEELARRINGFPDAADRAVYALRRAFLPEQTPADANLDEEVDAHLNPFEISVEETLKRFWQANVEEGWKFGEEVCSRLAATAPSWPTGELAFRSLRIRFGEGDKGVWRTFDKHCARLKRVSVRYDRDGRVRSDREHLRLRVGNHTHRPIVEWSCFDLRRNWNSVATEAHNASPRLVADEALVFAWMFPAYVWEISRRNQTLPIFATGYEVNCPNAQCGGANWYNAPLIDASRPRPGIYLGYTSLSSTGNALIQCLELVPILRQP